MVSLGGKKVRKGVKPQGVCYIYFDIQGNIDVGRYIRFSSSLNPNPTLEFSYHRLIVLSLPPPTKETRLSILKADSQLIYQRVVYRREEQHE